MSKRLLFLLLAASLFSARGLAQKTVADSVVIKSQDWQTDSLEKNLQTAKEDTAKAILLNDLSFRFAFNQAERGLYYFRQSIALSKKLNFKRGIANAYNNAAWCQWTLGNYHFALQLALKSLHLLEELNEKERIAWTYLTLSNIYRDFGDYEKALLTANQSIQRYNALGVSARVPLAVAGSIYELQNRLDSALFYVQKAQALDVRDNQGKWYWTKVLQGNIYRKRKEYEVALTYYRAALPLSIAVNVKKRVVDIYNGIALVHKEMGHSDSSIYYANEVLQKYNSISYQKGILDACTILADSYKAENEKDSTIKYLELSAALHKKLFNLEKQRAIQNAAFDEQLRQEAVERARQQLRNQLKLYGLFGFGLVLLVVAVLLWRNNLHRKKAYAQLQQQKQETDYQKTKAEEALQKLKSTQVQLIQKEKLASLGELTAGIAHEIQNPLNFVNNFSEVSTELVGELEQEAQVGNMDEVKAIAGDLKQNLQKITQHGTRASSIVKGMLEHSRTATGERQPTDLNALCEEYLRLAYHGFSAKDKEFNAELKTDYDSNLDRVGVVPQEIGRVLLNLYNNAFYAVAQKQKKQPTDYQPIVSVSTKCTKEQVQIRVTDNGMGIPEAVRAKIFQPFFTTKPTGEGTGLGLSLAYDIITKGHGGTLQVDSKEGEFTEFVIRLPTA